MEGSSGGNDMELLSKTLQVEHKLFYFDLKENPRGQYLKISEKTSATRSTIIVPVEGISWFLDLFNYYGPGGRPGFGRGGGGFGAGPTSSNLD
ncbi:hypothetical protein HHK36_031894 [Tetracentron sinense]|uniref:Uncharacterized protein n=1 Tax=Tetracentron sinense TaxID=13715 RepID=A0A834Y908_TETSI|nr:hypothetical protein HHK36_031894 [Tetracentron sinense]